MTQPYLAWSSPDGDLMVYASVGGSASGRIDGTGIWYAPGDEATVAATTDTDFFVAWIGSTPYADPTSPVTTIALDNHRVAAVQFGKLVRTAADLQAVTNDLAGCYVLTANIDLGGATWTPIGNASTGFTGEFYGNNHAVSNFAVEATASCAGFFGNIAGGRVEGLRTYGTVSSTAEQAGGFAGRICSRSLVKGCSFEGTVSSSSTKVGGFAGHVYDQPSVFRCSAAGRVAKTGSGNGNVGGFAGQQDGGFVADAHAHVSVDAGGRGMPAVSWATGAEDGSNGPTAPGRWRRPRHPTSGPSAGAWARTSPPTPTTTPGRRHGRP